jgi:ClpP class serine protease
MDLGDLIWLLLLAVLLQPALQQRLLVGARGRLRRRIEQERGSRMILLVHRQETMSVLGIPLMRFIDIEDSERVIRAIQTTDPAVPIDLVLHTPGGLALASLQIARAIRRHPAKVTAFIPHYAMSGGALIALAADEIVMCEDAVLGPVDPQINGYPAASVLRAVERKEAKDLDDETLIYADQAGMAITQLRKCIVELLEGRLTGSAAEFVARQLSEGQWTHDYPISLREVAWLGLPVGTRMPGDIMRMMELYPQPTRRASSVEYGEGRRRDAVPTPTPARAGWRRDGS